MSFFRFNDKEYFIERQSRHKKGERGGAGVSDVILLCWPPLAACGCSYQIQTCNPYKVAKGSETLPMPSGQDLASHSYQCSAASGCLGWVSLPCSHLASGVATWPAWFPINKTVLNSYLIISPFLCKYLQYNIPNLSDLILKISVSKVHCVRQI